MKSIPLRCIGLFRATEIIKTAVSGGLALHLDLPTLAAVRSERASAAGSPTSQVI